MPSNDAAPDRREIEEMRRDFDRELKQLRSDLKTLAGIDLENLDKMDAFRAGVKWSSAKIAAITEDEGKSATLRLQKIVTSLGAVVVALAAIWPLVERTMDFLLGGKHG